MDFLASFQKTETLVMENFCPIVREDIKTKNTLQFGHCPNYPNPPPPPPNSGNFTDFIRPTKTTFCAYGGKKY